MRAVHAVTARAGRALFVGCPMRATHLCHVYGARTVAAQCMECGYLTQPHERISDALAALRAMHGARPVTLPRRAA